MKVLVTTWFGTFLIDGEKVVKRRLFPKDPSDIAHRIRDIREGRILKEERDICDSEKDKVYVSETRQAPLGKKAKEHPVLDLPAMQREFGFERGLLREAMMTLGKDEVRKVAADRLIVQAVKAIDDLNKTANLLYERLREWFSLHFPELSGKITDEKYADLVAELGNREQILTGKDIGALGEKLEASESLGTELAEEDRGAIMAYASALQQVFKTRKGLDKYISERMAKVAPNLAHLAGPVIGARLIALAGSLERLSQMPSSTIQILGAEKAFFRSLSEGVGMPKHGVIFQHPLIHASSPWQRGKIARAFASKIAIAAKCDAHKGSFVADDLKKTLEKRVEDIKRQHPSPPKRRRPSRGKGRPRKGGNKKRKNR